MFYKSIHTSKQAIHQMLNRRMKESEIVSYLFDIIQQIRADHSTMCCRLMYFKIKPEGVGRDKFESLCNDWGFVSEKSPNYRRTTYSEGVIRFDNLLADRVLTSINEAFCSDITYYYLNDRFYYITFIIDAYSRYIIGHSVSKRLTTEQTTLPALQMAIKHRSNFLPEGIIFHSDGGGQYYDKAFLELTKKYKFKNSMCEYAYENGKAERINGVIKNNYLKHRSIHNFEELMKNVDHCVSLYNTEKPHKSLKYKTPLQVEKELLYSQQPTMPTMTKSLNAESQIYGASSP